MTRELFICLSKAKSPDLFYIWVTKLQAHRFFKKNETAHAHSRGGTRQAQTNGDLVTACIKIQIIKI